MIASVADHPPMYVSTPVLAIPPKLVKETVYMPSSVAKRLLGDARRLAVPTIPPITLKKAG